MIEHLFVCGEGEVGPMASFGQWLEKQEYARRTQRLYLGYVKRIEHFLRTENRPALRQCQPDDLKAFAETIPYTYASRTQARAAVRAYWMFLGRKEAPLWAIRSPRRTRMVCKALEPKQIKRLLDAARELGPYQYAACAAMYYEALRREEAASIQWDDLKEGWLRVVGKGAYEAYVPLHEEFVRALAPLPRKSRYVFPGRQPNTHIAPGTFNYWINLCAAAAHLKNVSCHVLRHTALAMIVDGTGDLRAAQEVARHSDPKVTAGYTRATKKRLTEAMHTLNLADEKEDEP